MMNERALALADLSDLISGCPVRTASFQTWFCHSILAKPLLDLLPKGINPRHEYPQTSVVDLLLKPGNLNAQIVANFVSVVR
jgi:hypothetical protein